MTNFKTACCCIISCLTVLLPAGFAAAQGTPISPCKADIDGNGVIGLGDIAALIALWGQTVNCDDGDPCTIDRCECGQCVHIPIPGCGGGGCRTDFDCDDGNPCTNDVCQGGVCYHFPITGCTTCQSAAQCDDGNFCTIDECINGQCVHTPIPGCCLTASQCDDGNPCTIDTCVGGVCVHTPIQCPPGTVCVNGNCIINPN